MAKLIFKGDAFAALMKAADETGKPIKLVHDEGIYLCCFAKKHEKPLVAYAKGYAPTDPDYWEKARDAVGGDDFAETINLKPDHVRQLAAPGAELRVNMTATQMEIVALAPPPAKKPRTSAARPASH